MKIFLSLLLATCLLLGIFLYQSNTPKISVVLLTYNRQEMLPRAIDSILNQTYKNFELIIINDASQDSTAQILKEYAQKDKRILIIENETNQGIVSNRNKGLTLATGKYLAWQDDDDISEPTRLEEQVRFLQKHKDIVVLGTQISLLNSKRMVYLWGTETDPKKAEIAFLIGRLPIILPTGMWRLDFIRKHNISFDKNYPLVEDFVIYDQILAQGGKIMTLDKTLYQYRLHRNNPAYYYYQITQINNKVYKERFLKFFPDSGYPETSCKRLKYVKEHNLSYDQKILDDMYHEHCKGKVFDPTGRYGNIVHEDGYNESVVVSVVDNSFYSERMKKEGKIIQATAEKIEILWDGDIETKIYAK